MNPETYIKKLKTKGLPYLQKQLTEVFNAYIRARDSQDKVFKCISCGSYKFTSQMNAGHYYASTFSSTKYDEDNVHGQCAPYCNMHLHGNLIHYREGLIGKIGLARVKKLDWKHHKSVKRDRFDYITLILEYKQKLNELL